MKMEKLVSVCIQTYRHSRYIKKCLDSILAQETDFDFEILLGEDESDDGTREICIEYAKKYPQKIRLFLHSRSNNIYVNDRPTGKFNFFNNLKNSVGKYIAICEGDDYWTDKTKLQKQIDFMESNTNYSICFHAVKLLINNKLQSDCLTEISGNEFTIADLACGNFIHTPSVVYRNVFPKTLPEYFNAVPVGDYPLHMLAARYGNIKYLPEAMAVYRIHEGGIHSENNIYRKIISGIETIDLMIPHYRDMPDILELLIKQNYRLISDIYNLCINSKDDDNLLDLTRKYNFRISGVNIKEFMKIITDLNARYNRLLNHPVSGKLIRFLAFLKNDRSFGARE